MTTTASHPGLPGVDTSSTSEPTGGHIQLLIKFNNSKTHLIPIDAKDFFSCDDALIIDELSARVGLPGHHIKLRNLQSIQSSYSSNYVQGSVFLSAYTCIPIRGGKGGFGTLLKGQSKQQGAKKTLDFGACRDLSGRRLRHVNDEIKLRLWRESLARRAHSTPGSVEEEINAIKTPSGIANWHLSVPSWSDVSMGSSKSKKSLERQMKKEVTQWFQEKDAKERRKIEERNARDRTIAEYAAVGREHAHEEEERLNRSIQAGMAKRRKTSHHDTTLSRAKTDEAVDESMSYLSALSGEFMIEDRKEDESSETKPPLMIQARSEFSTAVIPLDPHLLASKVNSNQTVLYYEVVVKTCGLAQIGWAKMSFGTTEASFTPNSDTGDGVGDDSFSYGFDGSRNVKFHDGAETAYGLNKDTEWKEGDIIGCSLNLANHEITYTINGETLGPAFEAKVGDKANRSESCFFPAFSLNRDEIIGINVGPTFIHSPKDDNTVGIHDILCAMDSDKDAVSATKEMARKEPEEAAGQKESRKTGEIGGIVLPLGVTKKVSTTPVSSMIKVAEQKTPAPIDLDSYNTEKELEALGMEGLKQELLRRDCKSGGSLQERAKRLFSLKGLRKEEYPRKVRSKTFKVT